MKKTIIIISFLLIISNMFLKAGLCDGSQGYGTPVSPYLIYTKADIQELADSSNTRDL